MIDLLLFVCYNICAMKKYYSYTVKKAVTVNNLVTLEYLDLSPSFTYPEEVHGFYEFAYVDKGTLICNVDGESVWLKQNDFYLIPPLSHHYYSVAPDNNASVFIACFNSKSNIINAIKGLSTLKKRQRNLIAKILSESQNAFKFPFEKKLILLDNPIFGAQQLIEHTIEEVLISLIRDKLSGETEIKIVMNSTELEDNLVRDITTMLKENVFGKIDLEYVSKKTFYSKTYLNNIFRKNMGSSIIQYYIKLKISAAKSLLKDGLTVTEIADKLCFDSPNYFSKVFFKHVGVTPSKYKQGLI